jgi:3-methyladenine DNA glycosylase AlkD
VLDNLRSEIRSFADPVKAKNSAWFFKTGPGQYGAGDKFLGLTTPQMRSLSKKYRDLRLEDVSRLIASPYHEERSIAVQILVLQFPRHQQAVYDFYLGHTSGINNWDLVDISAPYIVGEYLSDKPKDILYSLAKSQSLWERRISIISTFYFIRHGEYKDTLRIAEMLLKDKHDLIHKAMGWMLREVGKRCGREPLVEFLNNHVSAMPRTALRYSIEHFPEPMRKHYLAL